VEEMKSMALARQLSASYALVMRSAATSRRTPMGDRFVD
jgi:hypothetical protein